MLRYMKKTSFTSLRYMRSYQTSNGYPILGCIKNYYDVLNVPINCSRSEIKRAYFELSKKYHPDGSSLTSNCEEFVKVCEAYKILYNRDSRENYDTRLRSQFYMVPPVDMSYTNQNVHKSWKKYQAAMRSKQFGYSIPSFHGSNIVHKKPLVIKTNRINSMLSVIPTIIVGHERCLRMDNSFSHSKHNRKLLTYYLTVFSIVGVLLASEYINKRKRTPTTPSL